MNFWKVILATIVIYGAGVMSGGLLVNHVDRSHFRPPHRSGPPPASGSSNSQTNGQGQAASRSSPRLPENLSKQFLQQLDEELRLAPDQREAIQKIIAEGQNEMRKTMQDTRLEIREQLTQKQRNQFDELVKRPPRRPPGVTNAPPANVPAAATNAPGA